MEQMPRLAASSILEGVEDRPFSSGLIHFRAVLGIDAKLGRVHTAKNCSYMLAGVV